MVVLQDHGPHLSPETRECAGLPRSLPRPCLCAGIFRSLPRSPPRSQGRGEGDGRAPGRMLDTRLPTPDAAYPALYPIGIKASCVKAMGISVINVRGSDSGPTLPRPSSSLPLASPAAVAAQRGTAVADRSGCAAACARQAAAATAGHRRPAQFGWLCLSRESHAHRSGSSCLGTTPRLD
jgi:hypothetical protein